MSEIARPEAIMNALRRIVQALRQSSDHSEQSGDLTPAQCLVLKQIQRRDGLSVNELAASTFTHQSTVSEVVGRLEGKAMLIRKRAAADGRRVELHLTDKGLSALKAAPPSAHEKLLRAVGELPPDIQTPLAHGLEALIEAAQLSDHPVTMFFEDMTSPPSKV